MILANRTNDLIHSRIECTPVRLVARLHRLLVSGRMLLVIEEEATVFGFTQVCPKALAHQLIEHNPAVTRRHE